MVKCLITVFVMLLLVATSAIGAGEQVAFEVEVTVKQKMAWYYTEAEIVRLKERIASMFRNFGNEPEISVDKLQEFKVFEADPTHAYSKAKTGDAGKEGEE